MNASSSSKRPILFTCPGAGLGHLVRATSVAAALEDIGYPIRIVTHSQYARGLARLTRIPIDFIPSANWTKDLPQYAAGLQPRVVVLDTFPWGIRGEWKNVAEFRYVFMARMMKPDTYLQAAGLNWDENAPQLQQVIAAEPLDEYENYFTKGEMRHCHNRIRFPLKKVDTPVPEELDHLLNTERVWLVVHSGPTEEIDRLIAVAQEDMDRQGGGKIAAIIPKPIENLNCPAFEYFPAARLYERAFRVVTGAGYNAAAEASLNPKKHIMTPFHRRYDDQTARLEDFINRIPPNPTNAAAQAAEFIVEWL